MESCPSLSLSIKVLLELPFSKGFVWVREAFSAFYINLTLSAFIVIYNCRSTDIVNHIKPEVVLNYFVFPSLLVKLKFCFAASSFK